MATNAQPHDRFGDRRFDLQLFAGEKTEAPTERRREEARERGNVARSTEVNSVMLLLASFLTLRYYGPEIVLTLTRLVRFGLETGIHTQLNFHNSTVLLSQTVFILIKLLLPFFLVIVFTGVFANLAQTGFLFTVEPLVPNFERLDPIAGLENVFSWRAIGELVKSVFKIVIVAWVPYSTLTEQLPLLVRLLELEPMTSMGLVLDIAYAMAIRIILILLVVAIADWFFQSWRHEEGLKMSKEEIKEEYRQREGDPQVKAKIRERQRRLASKRMMAEVPKATVVVTNPTHLAVALFYDLGSNRDPKVVAKGAGLVAQRIKDIAREHGVPVTENKTLARALYDEVEIGQEIPRDLFEGVAAILAPIFAAKSRGA